MKGKREAKRQQPDFMKAVVVFCLFYLIAFTASCLYLIWKISYEPSTLIQWTFTIFGMELLVMALKKIIENRQKGRDNECTSPGEQSSQYAEDS